MEEKDFIKEVASAYIIYFYNIDIIEQESSSFQICAYNFGDSGTTTSLTFRKFKDDGKNLYEIQIPKKFDEEYIHFILNMFGVWSSKVTENEANIIAPFEDDGKISGGQVIECLKILSKIRAEILIQERGEITPPNPLNPLAKCV